MSLVLAAFEDLQYACAGTAFEASSPLVEVPKKKRAPKHSVKTGAEPAHKGKTKATTHKGKDPKAADKKRLTTITPGKAVKAPKHTVKPSASAKGKK